mgnify:CR=1 FL=1
MAITFNTSGLLKQLEEYSVPEYGIDFEVSEPSPFKPVSVSPALLNVGQAKWVINLYTLLKHKDGSWSLGHTLQGNEDNWMDKYEGMVKSCKDYEDSYKKQHYVAVYISVIQTNIVTGVSSQLQDYHHSFTPPAPKVYVNGPKATKDFLAKKGKQYVNSTNF